MLKRQYRSSSAKESLHHLILANVNFNSNNIKSNLTSLEKAALNGLKSNDNIVIMKVDKGRILILDRKLYGDGVKNLLNDNPYRLLSGDPPSQEL